MSERHVDVFDFFVSPAGSDEHGRGTAEHPFRSIERAVRDIAEHHTGEAPRMRRLSGYDAVEIVCILRPGGGAGGRRKLRHEFFIDVLGAGFEGDGSEVAPWSDLETALEGLKRLDGEGKIALQPEQRLRVNLREVFTSTRIEGVKRRREKLARLVFGGMTCVLIVPLLCVLGYLLIKAWPALSLSFLLENPRDNMLAGGIWSPLIGTIYLVCISLLVAAPIGILAGVYLNEYARDNWFTRIVNLAVVNLAGVPSIVHALFGVGAFVSFAGVGYSVLAASCTLAIMTLPVIITSTTEALASVPKSFREACWNMGASRWQTIRTIVLPNSVSGILTGVILQVSRAAGETAPILFTGAVFFTDVPDEGIESFFPYSLYDSCMALSYHLYAVMTQVKGASDRPEVLENIQFGTAVVLIGLVLAVNSVSIALRVYLRSRKKW